MAYEKQNFKDGQVLTAEMLNKMEAWMAMANPPYEETGVLDVIPEATLTAVYAEGDMNIFMLNYPANIVSGTEYSVVINGTEYKSTAFLYFDVMPCVGNFSVANPEAEDTGEPFFLMVEGDTTNIIVNGLSEITIKVSGEATVVHPLESKFMANAPLLDLSELDFTLEKNNMAYVNNLDEETSEMLKGLLTTAMNKGLMQLKVKVNLTEGFEETQAINGAPIRTNAQVAYFGEFYTVTAFLTHHMIALQIYSDWNSIQGTIKELSFTA